ncbi:hypothetical protein ALT_6130 [Aspergillus lentulus]|uniref:DUF3431 domain containing protein n=1 Tax=Aspergillus lentulus TaxID=293939 RepID=A0AAN4PM79_ASPLE|nr:hypothetical protein CNMCM6069_003062 [Aspergillus lentulus]GAQ08809.1 hypothetical protein ALT_6130 [Aspergillus lentulus]GFF61983.1 hypothetical protein IFM60648_00471 [Aspergillus lentulus]GFF64843.1 hypothetical protein IFM47457_00826 [Aspergillus lentulus]GFG00872.1 hypothetical protein IFM61392_01551 [Aspergillus lentulus]
MLFFGGGVQSPRRRNKEKAIFFTIVIIYALYFLFFAKSSTDRESAVSAHHPVHDEAANRDSRSGQASPSHDTKRIERDMVVASMKSDNTSWLFENFPDWHKSVYVVDDKNAELTVAQNKGRESMVYLTYIIDNYDRLPDVMLFIHSQRFQWHNDDPYYDGVPMLRRFQVPYLQKQGYVNLRCAWTLGCPAEIHPHTDTHRDDVHAGEYFKNGFMELFPGADVPDEVGVSCCAQFGVTSWKVRQRPKSDYVRFRKWLSETPLKDDLSGRIMEYSWHMIFGQGPVHCPTAEECYCKVFGLCDLTCPNERECAGRYVLPPYSTLPQGWPYIGWKGQQQDPSTGLPET